MIPDSLKRVSNPLTVIAIFAGLAEIAGTTVLPLLQPSVQSIFIWYVMGFPALLVTLFFLTLLNKHKVLYAPSDFKDDASFLTLLEEATQKAALDLDSIDEHIEEALKANTEATVADIRKELQEVRREVQRARMNAIMRTPIGIFRGRILKMLSSTQTPLSASAIAGILVIPPPVVMSLLRDFVARGKIRQSVEPGGQPVYEWVKVNSPDAIDPPPSPTS